MYVFSYFPFGFEGRIWDLTVSVPDHCLSFYLIMAPAQKLSIKFIGVRFSDFVRAHRGSTVGLLFLQPFTVGLVVELLVLLLVLLLSTHLVSSQF